MEQIRLLTASEIECRVATTSSNGASLLLYKDARCDMRILDECFGITGWQRSHELINGNLFCCVEIWDSEKKMWIRKQDVGTESNTEKEKGQASDSFKRACFNLGIGRELYTSPFIWVTTNSSEYDTKGKFKTKFVVTSIGYNENREINSLKIADNKGVERFSFSEGKVQTKTTQAKTEPKAEVKAKPEVKKDYIQSLIDTLNPDNDLSLITVLTDIKNAKTIPTLTTLYNSWAAFHANQHFTYAITYRKNEIKSQQS